MYLRQCIWHKAKLSLRFLFLADLAPKPVIKKKKKTIECPSGFGIAEVVLKVNIFINLIF